MEAVSLDNSVRNVAAGVTGTDGIDVISVAMGKGFPEGAFIAQDDTYDGANQNFKLVPWQSIASAFTPELTIDTTFSPRP